VEGVPVFRTTVPFAGCRQNEDLDRSVWSSGFLPEAPRTGDNGRPKDCRGGERRRHTLSMRMHPSQGPRTSGYLRSGDASFTRSFDSCSSILTEPQKRKLPGVRRAGQHRGRANLRKQEATGTGVGSNGRSATRRASTLPQGRVLGASKNRKEVVASVPARHESSGLVARTSYS
jgi:hypothetical protein